MSEKEDMTLTPPGPIPTPPNGWSDAFRIARLEHRVRELEERYESHREELESQDVRIARVAADLLGFRREIQNLSLDVGRVVSSQTQTGLGVERIEKKFDRFIEGQK